MLRFRHVLPLLVLVGAVSCDRGGNRPAVTDLADARALWATQGPSAYAITQQRLCFCPPPFEWTAVVSGGTPEFIASVVDPGFGQDPWTLDGYALDSARSVEEMFDWIEDLIGTADRITVEYDPQTGYPTLIDVDPIREAVDDEIRFTSRNLVEVGACTEIGCTNSFIVVLRASGSVLPVGLYDVRVRDSRGVLSTRSLTLDAPVASLSMEFPLPTGPVTVDVDVDGSPVVSFGGSPEVARLQPNGPLCPPVCYLATLEGDVP